MSLCSRRGRLGGLPLPSSDDCLFIGETTDADCDRIECDSRLLCGGDVTSLRPSSGIVGEWGADKTEL